MLLRHQLLRNLRRRGRHSSPSSRTSAAVAVIHRRPSKPPGQSSSRETSLHAGVANGPLSTTYRPVPVGPPCPSSARSAMNPAFSSSARIAAIRLAPPPPPLPLSPWIPTASLPLHLPETSASVPSPLSWVGCSPSPPSSPNLPRAYC
jgi:hypothetical protein